MNMIELQERLKDLSQEQLITQMQSPDGSAPQFMVLSEITRRKRMKASYDAQQSQQGKTTVAEEVMASAGVPQQGLATMASSMAPKSSMAQNTGVAALPQAQGMFMGGPVKKMQEGGVTSDPAVKAMAARLGMSVAEFLQQSGSEAASIEAGATSRARRDRLMGFDPTGDSITLPTQGDLDRKYTEEKYGYGPEMPGFPPPDMPYAPLASMTAPTPRTLGRTAPALDLDLVADTLPVMPTQAEQMLMDASTVPQGITVDQMAELGMPSRMPEEAAPPVSLSSLVAPLTRLPPAPDRSGTAGNGETDLGPSNFFDMMGDAWGVLNGTVEIGPDGSIDFKMPTEAPEAPLTGDERMGGQSPDITNDGVADAPPVDPAADPNADPNAVPGAAPPAMDPMLAAAVANGGAGGTGESTGGSTGADGGGVGTVAGGSNGYMSELEKALQRAERTKEQDKWLALAQTGMALMASSQPTLGGAIGEAGQVGIGAFRDARDGSEKNIMDLHQAIAAQKAAMQKAALAGRNGSGRSSGPKSIDDYLKSIDGDLGNIMTKDDLGMVAVTPGYEYIAEDLNRRRAEALALKYGMAPPGQTFDATQ